MIHLTLTQKIKEKLKEAQSFIAKAERGTISNGTCISDYIKLDILDNCINVTVTNGATQFFESTIECGEAAGNGEVIVESRMLFSIIGKRGDIILERKDNNSPLTFISKNSIIEIENANITFPMIPDFDNDAKVATLPIGKLAEGFAKVNYAVYKGDNPSLLLYSGVKVTSKDGVMTFIATDGSRIVCANVPADTTKKNSEIVIPQWLSGFICSNPWDNPESQALITYDQNHISVTVGALSIVSCRYLGQFSDMTKVISEKRWWISVSADDLKEVIQEILTLLPSRISQAKKTIFELEENALCIRTAQNIGTIKARVPCTFKDEDIPEEYINAYNPAFLLESINALPKTTNKLILGFSERGKPMAIMSYDDPDCLCLIAAVRFRDC